MRNACFFFIFLVIMMSCIGCSQNDDSNKPYSSEEAIKKGDVVETGITVYNFERFKEFLNNLQNQKADKIRVTGYTIEGDPIFTDLDYDGKNIHYTNDNSNDEYGSKEIVKDVCSKIVEEKKEQSKIWYSVISCTKIDSYQLISIDQKDFQYKQ